MRGMDTRHGAHQVAQKSTTVTRPFSMAAWPFPSRSGREIRGASARAVVGASRDRPREMATASTAAAATATRPQRKRSAARDGPAGMGKALLLLLLGAIVAAFLVPFQGKTLWQRAERRGVPVAASRAMRVALGW